MKEGVKSGIYQILHTESGKVYVGSAVCIKARWRQHRSQLSRGVHHSSHLQRAWNKYGESVFAFSVIEIVARVEELVGREQFWIDKSGAYGAGYNMTPVAGSNVGGKRTAETRAKMSAWQIGRKLPRETIERRVASFAGYRTSEETKAKLSAAQKGRPKTAETRARMKASYEWRNWRPSEAMIERSRAAHLGVRRSPEVIAKAIAKKSESMARKRREKQRDLHNRFVELGANADAIKTLAVERSFAARTIRDYLQQYRTEQAPAP